MPRSWRGVCKYCKKRNYVDEIAAKLVIAGANSERNAKHGADVVPKRAYPCPRSRYFHLTSQKESRV